MIWKYLAHRWHWLNRWNPMKSEVIVQLGHTTLQGAGAWSLSLSKCSEILHTKVSRKDTKSQRNTIIGLNGHVVYNNDKKIWNVSCLLKMRIEGQLHRSCRYKALPLQYGKSWDCTDAFAGASLVTCASVFFLQALVRDHRQQRYLTFWDTHIIVLIMSKSINILFTSAPLGAAPSVVNRTPH